MKFSKYKHSFLSVFSILGTFFLDASQMELAPNATLVTLEIAYETLEIAQASAASSNAASLESIGLSSEEIATLDTVSPDPKAIAKIRQYAGSSSASKYSGISSQDRASLARYIMISNLGLSLEFKTIASLMKDSLLRSGIGLSEIDNVETFLNDIIEGKALRLKNKKALTAVREIFAKLDNTPQLESQFLTNPINVAIDQQFPGFFSESQRTSLNSTALTLSGLSVDNKKIAQEIIKESGNGSITATNERTAALAYFLNLGQTNIGMLLLANTMGFDLVNSMGNILQAYKATNLPRNFSVAQTERFAAVEKAMSKNNLLSGSQGNSSRGNSSVESNRGPGESNANGRSGRPGDNTPERPSGAGGGAKPSGPPAGGGGSRPSGPSGAGR